MKKSKDFMIVPLFQKSVKFNTSSYSQSKIIDFHFSHEIFGIMLFSSQLKLRKNFFNVSIWIFNEKKNFFFSMFA